MENLAALLARKLHEFAGFVRGLSGWRRFALAFVTGLLSGLAFAPFGVFPFLLLAFAILVLLIDGAATRPHPVRDAAFAGWSLAFGQFLAGLYWVGYAFMVDAADHAWQMPFAVLFLSGGLALFPALACGIAAYVRRAGLSRIFFFAAAYATCEWLRGHVLTGFPWNIPAYGWEWSLGILQSTSVIGAYGLSLLTVLLGASLALFGSPGRRAHLLLPAALIVLFAGLAIAGDIRLAVSPETDVPGVHLRIVQPDVPQAEKYKRQFVARNWSRLVGLSLRKSGVTPNVLVWPEAAPPFLLAREPVALDDITVLTAHRTLITGAQRVEFGPGAKLRFYNSVYLFGHGGKIIGVYDKFHLVPFGEYVPFAGLLARLGVTQLAGTSGFTPGDGPHTYALADAPDVGPLVCYEILFPGAVVGEARPSWFVNVTDDSWFGPSSGPYQHLLTARVRAIEEGLPVVRAANTGISAVIDPLGRVRTSLGLRKMGVLDAHLPSALAGTVYARWGGATFWLLLALVVISGLYSAREERP